MGNPVTINTVAGWKNEEEHTKNEEDEKREKKRKEKRRIEIYLPFSWIVNSFLHTCNFDFDFSLHCFDLFVRVRILLLQNWRSWLTNGLELKVMIINTFLTGF